MTELSRNLKIKKYPDKITLEAQAKNDNASNRYFHMHIYKKHMKYSEYKKYREHFINESEWMLNSK